MIESLQRLVFHSGSRRLRRALQPRSVDGTRAGWGLVDALASQGKFARSEREWIDRIQEMRTRLSGSKEVIELKDFGAGSSIATPGKIDEGKSLFRTVGEICRNSSISRTWGSMLFQIVRHTRPSVCLELGTSLGISASYLGAACALNGNGSVLTLEGASSLAELARRNHISLGLNMVTVIPGRFQDTLQAALSGNHPVDFVFIDGHHDRDATIKYFAQIKPFLSNRAVVLFDDILWSRGMRQAWRDIRRNAGSSVTLDLMRMGVYLGESL